MHDICTYRVEVTGEVDEAVFNATSPIQIKIARMNRERTHFTIGADQSGLIGLMRHLHQQGFVLLSVSCEQSTIHSGDNMRGTHHHK